MIIGEGDSVDAASRDALMEQLVVFAEQTRDFVGMSDPWGQVVYLNEAARKRLGVDDVEGLTLAAIFPIEAFSFYYEVVRPELVRTGAWSGEVLVNTQGGSAQLMYVSTTTKLGPGGEVNGGIFYARELAGTESAALLERSDPDEADVGVAFRERVRDTLAAAHRDRSACALVVVDVIGIADIVESLGDVAVTPVMRSIGGRMARLARATDTVARIDDHQFGFLARGVRSQGEALRIARAVREALVDEPIPTAGGDVAVGVSVGVAFSEPDDDAETLIARASATASVDPPIRGDHDRLPAGIGPSASMGIDDLGRAMSHGEIRPYVEPVVDVGSGQVVGHRGLARWHHETLGILEAAPFIDAATETPLAKVVDLYIARETASVVALTSRKVALHLYAPASIALVLDARAEQHLAEIAEAFSLLPSQIHLEVRPPPREALGPVMQDAMRFLHDSGIVLVATEIRCVADVRAAHERGFDEVRVSLPHVMSDLVAVAHDLGLLVMATGVDDAAQRDMIEHAGCDRASGIVYGSRQPANAID